MMIRHQTDWYVMSRAGTVLGDINDLTGGEGFEAYKYTVEIENYEMLQ